MNELQAATFSGRKQLIRDNIEPFASCGMGVKLQDYNDVDATNRVGTDTAVSDRTFWYTENVFKSEVPYCIQFTSKSFHLKTSCDGVLTDLEPSIKQMESNVNKSLWKRSMVIL